MSKIDKYKENIHKFIVSKSCFSSIVTDDLIKEIMDNELCLFPIVLSAVFSARKNKNKIKSFHTLHISSIIVLMTLIIIINENKKYYNDKYGETNIDVIISQGPIHIFNAIKQNTKTMENAFELENEAEMKVAMKISDKINSFICDKLIMLVRQKDIEKKGKMKKTDIIKFKFNDNEIIEKKYKKLYRINDEDLLSHINDKYAIIGQCSIVLAWLISGSESNTKTLENIIKIGSSFGILVKLTNDFKNLETDILKANEISYNYIVNCGIHECFSLFDEHKLKFMEGCMQNELYTGFMKEIIENIEKIYDSCLENTENLELISQYSSFITQKSKKSKNSTK